MHLHRPILFGLAVLAAIAGPAAAADRNQVELALSDHESVPTRAALLRLDPKIDELLQKIVREPSSRPLARTRAISLLRLFPSKQSAATLRQVIRSARGVKQGLPLLNLQQALASYAVVAGPPSLKLVRPFLDHACLDVRHAAAAAVRLGRHPAALSVLQQRLTLEQSPTVRHQIQGQIEILRRPPKGR
jgi:hypothetical protein